MEKPISSSDKKNNPFEIPSNGSLGVLALGAVGIKAWRASRKKTETNKKDNTKNE